MVSKVFDTLKLTSTLVKFRLCEFYTIIQYSCFFYFTRNDETTRSKICRVRRFYNDEHKFLGHSECNLLRRLIPRNLNCFERRT